MRKVPVFVPAGLTGGTELWRLVGVAAEWSSSLYWLAGEETWVGGDEGLDDWLCGAEAVGGWGYIGGGEAVAERGSISLP